MVLSGFFWQILFGLYLLASLVQLAVWWGVFGQLVFRGSIVKSPIPEIPKCPVSVLICARNEAENLRRHLPAVLAQQYEGPWELIVVDDASEDETPVVLQFFQEKYPDQLRILQLVEKRSPGKKHALSKGIAAAKYDLLLLTDADCEPASPSWLSLMAAALAAGSETEIVLGYGPTRGNLNNEMNLTTFKKLSNFFTIINWSRYETAFVAAQYFSFALAGMPYMGVGRNLAFKRTIYDRVGGFSTHEHIASGDDDLLVNAAANAKNTVVCLEPESFVYSNASRNWSAWFRQKRRHLAAGPAYLLSHKMALALIALSHTGHYCLFFILLLAGFAVKIVLGFFILRLLSVLWIFGKILRVLQTPGLFFGIPFFDGLLALYYGIVVPWFMIRKKNVEWRRAD